MEFFDQSDDALSAAHDPTLWPEEDPPPEPSVMLPKGYLSASQVTQYLQCPHKYMLLYVLRVPIKVPVRMVEGSAVHRAAEVGLLHRIEHGGLPKTDTLMDAFSDAFTERKASIDDWEDHTEGSAKDHGYGLVREYLRDALPYTRPLVVERGYVVPVPIQRPDTGEAEIPFVMYIDSVRLENTNAPVDWGPEGSNDGVRAVYDLKVTTDAWSPEDIGNSIQMCLYSYGTQIPDVRVEQLVKGRSKDPEKAAAKRAKEGKSRYKVVEATVTERQVLHALDVVQGAAQGIIRGVYPKTAPDNWWCSEKYCSVWGLCRGKV